MVWLTLYPNIDLGLLPDFLSEDDPDKATVQLNKNYQHGGGWHPITGFELRTNNHLKYPGDPPLKPVALTRLRDELIILYDSSVVAVIQPDRSFEVSRMD